MYRRLMGMAGATALTVGGLGAVLATGGTAFASTPSSFYTIGYSVSGVTFASTSSVGGATANYTLGFVMPSNVDTTSTTLTLSGLPNSSASSSLPSTAIVTDTTANTTQVLTFDSSNGEITLDGAVAGDNYTVVLDGAINANVTTSTSYSPAIEVGSNDVGTASAFTLTPASTAANATASASTNTASASAVDTFSGFVPTYGSSTTTSSDTLWLDLSGKNQQYPTASSDYAVQVTSNGTTTSDSVSSVAAIAANSTSGYNIAITLGSAIPAKATVSVTIDGALNSGSTPTTTYVSMSDSTDGGTAPTTTPSTTPSADAASFLGAVGLTSTLAVNPVGAGDTATWSTSFTVPSGYTYSTTSAEIAPTLTGGTLPNTTEWAVFDATNAAGDSSGTGAVSLNSNVSAGDSITIDYYGVTNGSSSASAAFTLGGSAYSFTTNSVSLTSAPTSPVNVTLSDATPGAAANYTISGLAAPSGGILATTSSSTGGSIVLSFPEGTVLPGATADYTLKDLTTPSSSGVYGVTVGTSSHSRPEVTIKTTNTIAAGDDLQVTITGVLNPTSASNVDSVNYTGVVAAAQQVMTVPSVAMTYPNGALIQSGGQIDVVAGGYAFGIPTPAVLNKIMMMDHSSVQSGTFPTATMPAPGTLINPVGTSGYWVVGTNGDIYQFSSMSQFMKDGYVASQVIPVPNAGGLTAGAGAPPTAAATMSNGALVQFGSTIYEYAGGVPTGIATPAQLASIQKMTGAMVVMGSGSTPAAATTSANGTLVQPLGTAGIWVSDGGTLYQFMTASQFTSDGYSFQYVLPVAQLGTYTTSSI
jgi:hypothetical protein